MMGFIIKQIIYLVKFSNGTFVNKIDFTQSIKEEQSNQQSSQLRSAVVHHDFIPQSLGELTLKKVSE